MLQDAKEREVALLGPGLASNGHVEDHVNGKQVVVYFLILDGFSSYIWKLEIAVSPYLYRRAPVLVLVLHRLSSPALVR